MYPACAPPVTGEDESSDGGSLSDGGSDDETAAFPSPKRQCVPDSPGQAPDLSVYSDDVRELTARALRHPSAVVELAASVSVVTAPPSPQATSAPAVHIQAPAPGDGGAVSQRALEFAGSLGAPPAARAVLPAQAAARHGGEHSSATAGPFGPVGSHSRCCAVLMSAFELFQRSVAGSFRHLMTSKKLEKCQ